MRMNAAAAAEIARKKQSKMDEYEIGLKTVNFVHEL